MIRLLERRCPVCQELQPVGCEPFEMVSPTCAHCGHTLRPLQRCECFSCQRLRHVLTRQSVRFDEALVH